MVANALSVVAVCACLVGTARADEPAAPRKPGTNPAPSKTSLPPVVAYPAPQGEKLLEDFELKVAGQSIPVYQCRVSAMPFNQAWPGYQRPLDQTELASFGYWDASGPVDVEVVSRRPVESVAIRPTSRGIQAKVDKDHITFRIPGPGQITVEVNGWHKALHLFANPPAAQGPDPNAPGVRYFGPGVHKVGRIALESNQVVYLAGGAVVHGSIQAQGASSIRILGRGILDTSAYERGQSRGCIRLTGCRDVVIDGVILRDPDVWCLTTQSCSNVTISNVKLIGLWRYNADGIDICNSQDVAIRDCFIRSYDDSIAIKGLRGRSAGEPQPVRRVTAERCVIWNDWGRALEIGAETAAPGIAEVTFRDCDIIRTSLVALDIQHGDSAAVRNILFEKIRFEIDDVNCRDVIQTGPDDKFKPDANFCPRLLVVEIRKTGASRDAERGTVQGVTFRDIQVTGRPMPASRLQGYDAEHQVKGVTIENLRINGKVMKSLEEAAVEIKPFVQDVKIVAP